MVKCTECGEKLEEDTTQIFQCVECHEFVEDDDGPLYECSEDGTIFTRGSSANDNHQCPSCNKFASRQAEHGCPECQQGELELVDAYECTACGVFVGVH